MRLSGNCRVAINKRDVIFCVPFFCASRETSAVHTRHLEWNIIDTSAWGGAAVDIVLRLPQTNRDPFSFVDPSVYVRGCRGRIPK